MSSSKISKKCVVENMDEDSMDNIPENTDVVCWRNKSCQTRDARWLVLDNIYEKFHRPNFYDIGNTYINDVLDYTFTAKVERVGSIFLLHLFISNMHEGSFSITINDCNDLKIDRKNGKAYLSSVTREYKFEVTEGSHNHLTTYSFSDLDVDSLKDKKLYIAVSHRQSKGVNQEIIDDVKANHDFRVVLKESIDCDFVIESGDGEKFKVHKAMLAVHSEVFKAMLKEETAESRENYVMLIDVGKEDLQCILEFIYTGTVQDLENSNWFNLLMLADKYDLKGLRELSQHALAQQLAIDNALEVLMVADMYNSDDLKMAALKFIKNNVSTLKTSTFKEINNASLFRELCEYLVPMQ